MADNVITAGSYNNDAGIIKTGGSNVGSIVSTINLGHNYLPNVLVPTGAGVGTRLLTGSNIGTVSGILPIIGKNISDPDRGVKAQGSNKVTTQQIGLSAGGGQSSDTFELIRNINGLPYSIVSNFVFSESDVQGVLGDTTLNNNTTQNTDLTSGFAGTLNTLYRLGRTLGSGTVR